MYCSESCLQRANNLYHRMECQIWSLEEVQNSSYFDMMAVRALLMGTEQGVGLKNLMEKLTIQEIFEEKNDPRKRPFVNDYCSVLKLCRTFKRSAIKRNILPAVRMICILQRLGFFKNELNREDKEQVDTGVHSKQVAIFEEVLVIL